MGTISHKNPIALLRSAFNTIISHPVILFPYSILAFIQLLILEILFFSVRWPLSNFFAPLVYRFEEEVFLHYPYNFILLTKWFQQVQAPLYIIFSSFLMGMSVEIIQRINSDQRINLREVFKNTLACYTHLFLAALLAVVLQFGLAKIYGLLMERALLIRSTSGIYFLLKMLILKGVPYFNLIFAVLVMTLFAFVVPSIVIERKKIGQALILGFRYLWGSLWFVFLILLLPGLLYIPILLLKTNSQWIEAIGKPEVWGIFMVITVFVTLFIDALQVTVLTIYYLLKKEVS